MNIFDMPLLRDTSPLATFLNDIRYVISHVLNMFTWSGTSALFTDPLFLFGFGFIAVMGVVGIVGRLLSRD